MDANAVTKVLLAFGSLLGTVIGFEGRQRRLRKHIRENLELVRELEKDDLIREYSGAVGWLKGKIAVDVAKLAGHQLGTRKKPIPWGSVLLATVIAASLGYWTYAIVDDGFVWYSVFPGLTAGLFLISILGMLTDRQLPPDEGIPEGAVEIRTDTASEQVASAVAFGAGGQLDDRWRDDGQIGVVLQFVDAVKLGDYESALEFVDQNFLRCRVQAWLWNNRSIIDDIEHVCDSMIDAREPADLWSDFVSIEQGMYRESLAPVIEGNYGVAGNRRRIGPDHDLVIMAPVGPKGGYWVNRATAIPAAVTFVVSRDGAGWKVAMPFGSAPPVPGWPPTWWLSDDPAIDALEG